MGDRPAAGDGEPDQGRHIDPDAEQSGDPLQGADLTKAQFGRQSVGDVPPQPIEIAAVGGETLGVAQRRESRAHVRDQPGKRPDRRRRDRRDQTGCGRPFDAAAPLVRPQQDGHARHREVHDVGTRPPSQAEGQPEGGPFDRCRRRERLAAGDRIGSAHCQQDGGQADHHRRPIEQLLTRAEPHRRRWPHPGQQSRHPGRPRVHQPPGTPPDQHRADPGEQQRRQAQRQGGWSEQRVAHRHRQRLGRAAVVLAPQERRPTIAPDVTSQQARQHLVRIRAAQ